KSFRRSPEPTPPAKTPPPLPEPAADSATPTPTLEQEKGANESQLKSLDKDIQELKLNLEKIEMEAKNRREAHQQSAHLLRLDAEREIKYLERKLQEDTSTWSKQLSEREKALQQTAHQSETGHS